MSINTDINEVISKHLPQALGSELQIRLAQADKDAAEVTRLKETVASLNAANQEINGKLAAALQELSDHKKLAEREAAVAELERSLENRMLKHQLTVAEGSAQFARDVAMGLVRNTEYRHSVFESTTGKSHPVQQGGMVQQAYSPESSTRTVEGEAK